MNQEQGQFQRSGLRFSWFVEHDMMTVSHPALGKRTLHVGGSQTSHDELARLMARALIEGMKIRVRGGASKPMPSRGSAEHHSEGLAGESDFRFQHK
jgi:hypothetical protein